MVKVRFIVAPDPIVDHLEVLAVGALHTQSSELRDASVQLTDDGMSCVLQPSAESKQITSIAACMLM